MTTAPAVAVPVYRMAKHPGRESEVTLTARCLAGGCVWESEPTPDDASSVGCESHTATTGHTTFAVTLEYVALVTRE
ncbi:hypothetical protein HHL19_11460 [Streptomyces sp. R302]|uniref:hypothetical protein n=1 Tax=unclassified Streptomyces TaxID=2593676 RepID=UPI00145FC340|nr:MULTISPECIES: hypothetical protein [unclassified Streptomyces]NML50280.1 hypothetical protein [Streptomyces sp. R301]NML79271.1 hypothetical protein [Streptomyces sp. R302]